MWFIDLPVKIMARILISLFVIILSIYLTEQAYFVQQEYIDNINNVASTWKVSNNRKIM